MARTLPTLCLVGVFTLVGFAPLAFAVGAAPPSGQTAVLFDPRLEQREILLAVAASDAKLVRFGALPGSAVIDVREGAHAQLAAAGAWLMADPILLGGCQTDFYLDTRTSRDPI